MSDELKEAAKRRIYPFMELMLAEGQHQLEIKKLALEMFNKGVDLDEAYDRFYDEMRAHAERMRPVVEAVYRMMFIEGGGNRYDWDLTRFQMKHASRRRLRKP